MFTGNSKKYSLFQVDFSVLQIVYLLLQNHSHYQTSKYFYLYYYCLDCYGYICKHPVQVFPWLSFDLGSPSYLIDYEIVRVDFDNLADVDYDNFAHDFDEYFDAVQLFVPAGLLQIYVGFAVDKKHFFKEFENERNSYIL